MSNFFGKIINIVAHYPLHYAAQTGNYAAVRRHINLGVPIESRYLGFTPLYLSTRGNTEDRYKCTIELLKHGASPDAIVSCDGQQMPILATYFDVPTKLNLLRLLALHSKLLPNLIKDEAISDEIKERLKNFYSIQSKLVEANNDAENFIQLGDYSAAYEKYQQIKTIWLDLSEDEQEQVYKDYYVELAQSCHEKADNILRTKPSTIHLKQH